MTIKVMTFNVRGSNNDDGVNIWDKRRVLNIETIQKYAPDLIGFQEVQNGNRTAYAYTFTDYDTITGFEAWREKGKESNPIYWRRERFNRLDSGAFYLSETPNQRSVGWDASLERVATWVKLHDMQTATDFLLLNTHFDHRGEQARTQSAELIVRQAHRIAPHMPHIITGDFNALPTDAPHRIYEQAGYSDTYLAAGYTADVNTMHRFQGRSFTATAIRIDWIFTSGHWHTRACQVILDADPPLYPSDHYPVLAELSLTSEQ